MGGVHISCGKNSFGDVTLEVFTQSAECRERLCDLSRSAISDRVSFLTVEGIKVLIGFKDKRSLEISETLLFGVLTDFSDQVEAKFWNT